jgi:nitrogen fixation protein NifU and related proteins
LIMTDVPGAYHSIVMDHFTNPRNTGEMENADGIGEARNPVCGDTLRLFIRVEADRIVEATFLAFGCVPAIAASSMTTEMIRGMTIEEVLKITRQGVSDALGGLPPTKGHCSVLAETAIKAAVSDYRKRNR